MTPTPTPTLDTFTRAYIGAALWSSTAIGSPNEDEADPPDATGQRRGTFDRSFQDCHYGVEDLSPALLAQVVEDCRAFQETYGIPAYGDPRYSDAEKAGHDFWLTRNSHGAGFWDRGLPNGGEPWDSAASAYGESHWCVGDDGLIYGT